MPRSVSARLEVRMNAFRIFLFFIEVLTFNPVIITTYLLDIRAKPSFSQSMRITPIQIDRLVRKIFDELKNQNAIEFKDSEDKVFKKAVAYVVADFAKEAQLDVEVNKMLDQLEKKNPGEFQRYKMFPLLKKRMAQEKGIVL